MATLSRAEWKALHGCNQYRPITATRVCSATPYNYRAADGMTTITEAMMLTLTRRNILVGKIVTPGLSPDIHFTPTAVGEIALEAADKKFGNKKERGAG